MELLDAAAARAAQYAAALEAQIAEGMAEAMKSPGREVVTLSPADRALLRDQAARLHGQAANLEALAGPQALAGAEVPDGGGEPA